MVRPAPAPAALVLPFAVVGLAGGWLLTEWLGLNPYPGLRALLLVMLAAMAALLGWWLARHRQRVGIAAYFPPMAIGIGLGGGVAVGGLFGGCAGLALGAVLGALSGLLFTLPLAPLAIALRRVGRARGGTEVNASHGRAVWVACAVVLLPIASLIWGEVKPLDMVVSGGLAWASMGVLVAAVVLDARGLLRVARAARRVEGRVPLPATTTSLPPNEPVIDFGVGHELAEIVTHARDVYRDMDRRATFVRGSPARATRALSGALVLDVLALAGGGWLASRPRDPPPEPASTVPALAPPSAVRSVRLDAWPGGSAQIVGVNRMQHQAVLRLEAPCAPEGPRLRYAVVDYADGSEVERWDATPENASALVHDGACDAGLRGASPGYVPPDGPPPNHPAAFGPLSGGFKGDLWHAADLAAKTDDKSLGDWLVVSPGGDRVVYDAVPKDGSEGDWLWTAQPDGSPLRVSRSALLHRLDPKPESGYAPAFSPDGARIAWLACAHAPCEGVLMVALARGDKAARVDPARVWSAPQWGADGERLYAVGTVYAPPSRVKESCLYAIDVRSLATPRALYCSTQHGALELRLSPDRKLAVVGGFLSDLWKAPTFDVQLVLLGAEPPARDAQPPRVWSVDGATGLSAVSNAGFAWVSRRQGLAPAVLDLVGPRQEVVPVAEGELVGATGAVWIDGHTALCVRTRSGSDLIELVTVDAGVMFAAR